MKEVIIYTDGACSGNPGPGGYGAVLFYNGNIKEISGNNPATTNNRMELTACIEALKALNQKCKVTLYTDSKYVFDCIDKGWAKKWKTNGWTRDKNKPAQNSDLLEELLNLVDYHDVKFEWVKGHDGQPQNERCDFLARNKIKELLNSV